MLQDHAPARCCVGKQAALLLQSVAQLLQPLCTVQADYWYMEADCLIIIKEIAESLQGCIVLAQVANIGHNTQFQQLDQGGKMVGLFTLWASLAAARAAGEITASRSTPLLTR